MTIIGKQNECQQLREVLLLLLDQVDYTRGACKLTEMVGAVLPKEVIARCRAALTTTLDEDGGNEMTITLPLVGLLFFVACVIYAVATRNGVS